MVEHHRHDDSEASPLERRIFKLSDLVNSHEGRLGEHGVLIGVLTQQVEALRSTTASRDQLDNHSKTMESRLDNAKAMLTSELAHIQKAVEGIQGWLKWGTMLVLGAVVLAILAIVFKQ